jgi:hypothetical protein
MVRRRLILAAGAALLALATCSNPIDFNAAVEDSVKVGKDMYLKVVAVTPAKGDSEADPSSPVVLQFDRALNPDTIDAAVASVSLSVDGSAVSTPWTSSFYNEATEELYLYHAALTGDKIHTVVLGVDPGLAGVDGSTLRDSVSWSFTTKDLPGGSLNINSGVTYTTSASVTLAITYNYLATNVRYSNAPFAQDDVAPSWQGGAPSSVSWTLTSGDATKSVYYQFAGASDKSSVFHADIILDTTPPIAPTITASATSVPTWVSGGGGNGYYRFYVDSGTLYTNRTSTSYTYLLSTGSHTIYVAERDAAGNYSSYASATFTAAISPLSGATLISTLPTLYWSSSYSVALYGGIIPLKGKTPSYSLLGSGISSEQYTFSAELPIRTTYYWYYTYTIFSRTYTKGPYHFTTASF